MFIFLFTAFFVVLTIVIVWLSLRFKETKHDYEVSFSWAKGLKCKKT